MIWQASEHSWIEIAAGNDHLAIIQTILGSGLSEGETAYEVDIIRKHDGAFVEHCDCPEWTSKDDAKLQAEALLNKVEHA